MIRFLPDTWLDALLRPLAMAFPDGGVYVEIIAPDFRFLFAIVLALAWAPFVRRTQRGASAALVLLVLAAVAFVPWLATTGNGRYFIPILLISGPLCIGLLHMMPATRSMRAAFALLMVACQAFLIAEIPPWRYWGHVAWADGPAFPVDVPKEVAARPATYVTLSSISYSLIAPSFHPASRWVNIATQPGLQDTSPDGLRTQAVIAAPGPLKVIFPTVPGEHGIERASDRIDPTLVKAIDDLLARQGLSIENERECRLLPSAGLAGMASSKLSDGATGQPGLHGFWLCPLARHASDRVTLAPQVPARLEQVFEKMERVCPRFFRAGEAVSLAIPGGAVRGYPGSDFKLYVFESGQVWYKYYRALNPVLVGNMSDVLAAGFSMDCSAVQGRSGLPWEREI